LESIKGARHRVIRCWIEFFYISIPVRVDQLPLPIFQTGVHHPGIPVENQNHLIFAVYGLHSAEPVDIGDLQLLFRFGYVLYVDKIGGEDPSAHGDVCFQAFNIHQLFMFFLVFFRQVPGKLVPVIFLGLGAGLADCLVQLGVG